MSKGNKSIVLPICMKNDMYKYINNLVVSGRYKSKAGFVKKAIYEKMKRDKRNKNICDTCHQKFKKSDDIDISIEHVDGGVEIKKIHKCCRKKSSIFDNVFDGVKISA